MECPAQDLAGTQKKVWVLRAGRAWRIQIHVCLQLQIPRGRGSRLLRFTLVYFSQQPGALPWAHHGTPHDTSEELGNLWPLEGEGSLSTWMADSGLEFRFPDSSSGVGDSRHSFHSQRPFTKGQEVSECAKVPMWLGTNDQVFKMETK